MIKQVIVVRTKYPDNKGGTRGLRAGKMCSQAAHASMLFLVRKLESHMGDSDYTEHMDEFSVSPAQFEWLTGNFTKIILQVGTETELINVYENAVEAGLEVHLVEDIGSTEFGGVSTYTALAIGPHEENRINPITGKLRLY